MMLDRALTATLVEGRYQFTCSCGYLERTCVVCRHVFVVLWHMFGSWRLHEFKWHRITTKKFYYTAIVTDKPIDFEAGLPHCYPTISASDVDSWLESHDASAEGVPTEGRIEITLDDDSDDHQIGGHDDDPNDEGGNGNESAPKRLRANVASCDAKFLAITSHLGNGANSKQGYKDLASRIAEYLAATVHPTTIHDMIKASLGPVSKNQAGFNAYHRFLDEHLSIVTSRAAPNPVGHPTSKRLQGWWERGKFAGAKHDGSKAQQECRPVSQQQTRHASQQSDAGQELRPDSWHVNFDGKVLESARAYLRRWGAREGWIVEVFPDRDHPEYEPGDRWFMTITNGLVQGPETAQHITACKWMKKNSVATLDSRWRQPESCEILQVKAYGPPDCRLFKAFNQ